MDFVKKLKQNKKMHLIILLIISLIVLLSVFCIIEKNNNIVNKISSELKKEENNLDITYHIEGNNNDIKCCIYFNSSIAKIEYITTPDENIIYPNRKKVAIDYRIQNEQDYLFKIKCEGESEYLYTITNKQEEYPKITQIESRNYAIITEDGIKCNVYKLDFGDSSENYYSIDNGNTWKEYAGENLDIKKDTKIIAKTINGKNSINRIAIAKMNWASDAIKPEAYDGNVNSYFRRDGNSIILVDETMRGKELKTFCKAFSSDYCHGGISAYNSLNQRTVIVGDYTYYNSTIIIPDDCVKLVFYMQSHVGIYELEVIKVNKYTVQFNTNGGSNIENQKVLEGQTVTKPETDPTKENYLFGGWYQDEELTTEFDFTRAITEDTIIYAKWKNSIGIPYESNIVDYWPLQNSLENTINEDNNFSIFKGNPQFIDGSMYLDSAALVTNDDYELNSTFTIVLQTKNISNAQNGDYWGFPVSMGYAAGGIGGYFVGIGIDRNLYACASSGAGDRYCICTSFNNYTADQWHTSVIKWDGTNFSYFIDGEKIGSSSAVSLKTSKLYMGATSNVGQGFVGYTNGYTNGYYKNLIIYNGALTDEQIEENSW